jgi:hypothetical protein
MVEPDLAWDEDEYVVATLLNRGFTGACRGSSA